MPKIPLVSSPYPSRFAAVAASEMINLYAETTENAADQSKNAGSLFLCPGRRTFIDLDSSNGSIRGFWSGGGRLFVAQGLDLVEVNSSAAIVSRTTYTAVDDGLPVTMFGNINQLLLVSGGQAYIDNGSGPVACRFQLNGQIGIAGNAVTWVSGDLFPTYTPGVGDPLPASINITFADGSIAGTFAVASWNSSTSATLVVSLAGGSGQVALEDGDVFWGSGTVFDPNWVGMPIVIGGVTYTVASVPTQYTMTLVEPTPPGIIFPLAYSVTIGNVNYSTAGGDLVTAVSGAFLDGSFYVQRPAGGSPDLGRQVNFSGTFDGTSWSGLDFITKEGNPDYIRSIWVDAEILYIFGTESVEAWQTDPNTGLPTRIPGQVKAFGSISRWGPNSIKNKVYFVDGGPQGESIAYRIDGATPVRISTHAEEEQWRGQLIDCISYCYEEDGHVFWVINMGSQAWHWDETEKSWGKRMQWNGTAFTPYQTFFHTFINEWGVDGTHITGGDPLTGIVYQSSAYFYDDNGADMAWRKALGYRSNGNKWLYPGRMDLLMQTGTVPSGPAPVITRDYSLDNGKTFVNPQTAQIGIHNQTNLLVYWPTSTASNTGIVWRLFGKGQYGVALIDLECEETAGDV